MSIIPEYLRRHAKYLTRLDEFRDEVLFEKEKLQVNHFPCEQTNEGYALFLSRFLIASKGNETTALKGLKAHLEWYKKHDVQRLTNFSHEDALGCCKHHGKEETANTGPCDPTRYIFGKDKKGHSVIYVRGDVKRVKRIIRTHSVDDCIKYHIWLNENLFRIMDKEGKNSQITCVIDVRGLNVTSLATDIISFYKKQFWIDQNQYPERCYKIVLINVPTVFSFAWSLIKMLLDPQTINKITVCKCQKNNCKNSCLLGAISHDQIPKDFGGSGPSFSEKNLLCNYLTLKKGVIGSKDQDRKIEAFVKDISKSLSSIVEPQCAC
mmetsp:Transcript_2260/g.2893  ORF Transcript_2260/g.2893 Transcript_2260/m.2893 type:complete len:322 (-) Transcript_2260:116-1081(-)